MILMMIFITIDEHVEGIQQRVRPGLVEDDSVTIVSWDTLISQRGNILPNTVPFTGNLSER